MHLAVVQQSLCKSIREALPSPCSRDAHSSCFKKKLHIVIEVSNFFASSPSTYFGLSNKLCVICMAVLKLEVVLSNYVLVILQGALSKHGQTPKKSAEDDGHSVRFSGSPREPLLGGKR